MSEPVHQAQINEESPPQVNEANHSPAKNSSRQSRQLQHNNEENLENISLVNFNPQQRARKFLTR